MDKKKGLIQLENKNHHFPCRRRRGASCSGRTEAVLLNTYATWKKSSNCGTEGWNFLQLWGSSLVLSLHFPHFLWATSLFPTEAGDLPSPNIFSSSKMIRNLVKLALSLYMEKKNLEKFLSVIQMT